MVPVNVLLPWPYKLVYERFPVLVDWAPLIGETPLVAVEVAVLSGTVTVNDPYPTNFQGTEQVVFLAGGKAGEYASFECRAVLEDGRRYVQMFYQHVR